MTQVSIDGREVRLSNLEKVMYPETGFTKGQVIDYYARVGEVMVPHLADRPITMVRYPDGVDGGSFFEKRCPDHAPEWIRRSDADPELVQCVIDDLPSLVWAANMASLELHTLQARARKFDTPTAMVFDLDPGAPAGIIDCCRVGLELRDVLGDLGLESVVKTSGSKGLHLAVPLNTPRVTADQTKEFALAAGQLLAKRDRTRVTTNMNKDQRKGKVFVDWSQNDRHKTTVCAYSLRARPRPTVSTPVTWDEVEAALDAEDPELLDFESADVLDRIEEAGDLYAANLETKQKLPELG
jgi:bifunctional non-homologous end joining protein LigD